MARHAHSRSRVRGRGGWHAATTAFAICGLVVAPVTAYAAREHPNQACLLTTVRPGDTVWRIAVNAGVSPYDMAPLNPHIADLNVIYPGDQIATSCPADPPAAPLVPELLQESMPAASSLPLGPVAPSLPDYWAVPGSEVTARGVVAELYDAGFRGNALVTMAATSECESGGRADAVGDEHLETSKWGPSIGLTQVRSLRAEEGSGSTRDGEALADPGFNARAAFAISSAGTDFDPWTCYRTGAWRRHADEMRAAADGLGLLGGDR